jgi:hypothetical protein
MDFKNIFYTGLKANAKFFIALKTKIERSGWNQFYAALQRGDSY